MTTISIGNGLPVPVLIGDVMTDQDWLDFSVYPYPGPSFTWVARARTPMLPNGKSYLVSIPFDEMPFLHENELRSMMTKAFNER